MLSPAWNLVRSAHLSASSAPLCHRQLPVLRVARVADTIVGSGPRTPTAACWRLGAGNGILRRSASEKITRSTENGRFWTWRCATITGEECVGGLQICSGKSLDLSRHWASKSGNLMMMIAFITVRSSLVPLIEGLCAQIYFRFEISVVCVHIFCFSFSEEKNVKEKSS